MIHLTVQLWHQQYYNQFIVKNARALFEYPNGLCDSMYAICSWWLLSLMNDFAHPASFSMFRFFFIPCFYFSIFRWIRNQFGSKHTNDEVGSLHVSFQFRPRILVILKINTQTHRFAMRFLILRFATLFCSSLLYTSLFDCLSLFRTHIDMGKSLLGTNITAPQIKERRKENNGLGFCQ